MTESRLATQGYVVTVEPGGHFQDVRVVIVNGISLRSEVQRSQNITICVTTSRHSRMHKKEYSPMNAVQDCGKIIPILLIMFELQRVDKKTKCICETSNSL